MRNDCNETIIKRALFGDEMVEHSNTVEQSHAAVIPNAVDISPGIYEHYKGKRYEVLGTARHSETFEVLVVYRALYENDLSQLWVRPVALFTDEVAWNGRRVPRFIKV